MNPTDFLSLIAELSMAVAGFSGVVVALGRRSDEARALLSQRLLTALLVLSFITLFSSGQALVLLYANVAEADTWAICGVTWSLVMLVDTATTVRTTFRDTPSGRPRAILLSAGLALVMGLQAANVVWVRAFWPFSIALVWTLAVALHLFMLLLTQNSDE